MTTDGKILRLLACYQLHGTINTHLMAPL